MIRLFTITFIDGGKIRLAGSQYIYEGKNWIHGGNALAYLLDIVLKREVLQVFTDPF
jgi:hypothetical protein